MLRNLFAPLAMRIAAGLLAAALVFGGVQTMRLAWAHSRIAKIERNAALAIAAAEKRAREAEREAEAAYAKSEQVRIIETNTIREVARKAENANPEAARRDCGSVTSAVLDSLRQAGADPDSPAD